MSVASEQVVTCSRPPSNPHRRSIAGTMVDPANKPPVPPTKAAAVAKIRETIMAAKRESCQNLSQESPDDKDNKQTAQIQNKQQEPQTEGKQGLDNVAFDSGDVQSKIVKSEESTDAEKEARKAAIRAKIREALLSAAASGALNSAQDRVNNNNQTSIVQPQKHLNNNLINNNTGKGQINKPLPQKANNGVQRKTSTSSLPEKKRETISKATK